MNGGDGEADGRIWKVAIGVRVFFLVCARAMMAADVETNVREKKKMKTKTKTKTGYGQFSKKRYLTCMCETYS